MAVRDVGDVTLSHHRHPAPDPSSSSSSHKLVVSPTPPGAGAGAGADADADADASSYMHTPPATPQHPPPDPSSSSRKTANMNVNPAGSTVVTTIACARCKQKKIKCDGNRPSCAACKRAGVSCTVPDIISHQGLARGHIETLEGRVSELQSLIDTKTRELEAIRSRHASFASSHLTDSPVPSDPFTPSKRSSASSGPRSALEPTPELPKHDGPLADLSLARLLVQTFRLNDQRPCISKLSHLVANERSTAFGSIRPADGLPPEPVGAALCAAYLANEQVCFPFLSRRDIVRLCRGAYSAPDRIDPSDLQDRFRLYMIFAIACLSHPPGVDDPQGDALRFYKSALICREHLPAGSRLSLVQNTLLLCLFSLHAKVSQDAWRLSRRALHISIEGEFHLSRRSGPRTSDGGTPLDRIQRRVFWSAYCFNRMTSNVIYDRPPSIPEAGIDVEIPPDFELDADDADSVTLSLLPCLVRLYGLSTEAFTSFNSLDPPPGDTVTQLTAHMSRLSASGERLIDHLRAGFPGRPHGGSPKDVDWAPPYIAVSFNSHAMLMFSWAMTSIASQHGGVPASVQALTINHCIETVNFFGLRTEKFGHLRIVFVIVLRSLVILLSALLAKVDRRLAIVTAPDTAVPAEELDRAVVVGILFLRNVGGMQGQGCEFLPALVLALRHALFERELGPPPNGGYPVRAEKAYSEISEAVKRIYPGVSGLAAEMGVASLPIGLGLKGLEDITDADVPPSRVFNKFGSSGKDLEELTRQIGWRLKIQYGVGDPDTNLHAFRERMGVGRSTEVGFPGFGRPGFDVDGIGVGQATASLEAKPYEPSKQAFHEWTGAPKMDVDFSGFETNIVTYE